MATVPMAHANTTAVVTGAAGQDGYYLVARLLSEGAVVHATIRDESTTAGLESLPGADRLTIHELNIADRRGFTALVRETQPDEFYNFAGQSSVARSFNDPSNTWESNAHAVFGLLEAIRLHSPGTRFYQSSSTDMFGCLPGLATIHDELSPFMPQSPYAAAKAAAHLLCGAYRRAYDLRIACGILSNHESRRRAGGFLTREVVDHVRRLRDWGSRNAADCSPLLVGNLAAKRDWGFAPDYVDGVIRVARQIPVRAATSGTLPDDDAGSNYRDYVLGSGRLHAVWELIDRAFSLAGFPLVWHRTGRTPAEWSARFRDSDALAVAVDPERLRPSDPAAIGANPSRAFDELGWRPQPGLDALLTDMLSVG